MGNLGATADGMRCPSSSTEGSSHRSQHRRPAQRSHRFKLLSVSMLAIVVVLVLNLNVVIVSCKHHRHHSASSEEFKFDPTNSFISLVLPHDTYPGYSIQKFTANFTSPNSPFSSISSYSSKPLNYRLLETDYSKYFTVLDDGMVMTTSDLSPLVNRPVKLVVLEETPNSTATHQLQLYIMNRKDMLHFPSALGETVGELSENKNAGTRVRELPLLQANSARGAKSVIYSIVHGNDGREFALEDSSSGEIKGTVRIDDTRKHGVWLVSNKPLDRETKDEYSVVVEATDAKKINKAQVKLQVKILDVNDNHPVFTKPDYRFTVNGVKSTNVYGNETITWERFTSFGKVEAKDADGDKVAYRLMNPSNMVVIVPQTGELLLAGEPDMSELFIDVDAHDIRTPSLNSEKPARVLIEFVAPDPVPVVMQHLNHEYQHSHRRDKRRVTRAVRPTKRIDFTEAEGDTEGRNVFQLEKETDRETFKIRDENPWVTVETNGAVRVKKKWDYEELGPEKTIDFWVIITNQGHNGECRLNFNLLAVSSQCR
ncbi:neural-cadherin-like [Malaya genurostris]|uniref:neural-cadherin-like n=1 Tax=Malaya genurostris TaxID=325434 RepID=UPI0026F39789|nr:neural-cadherin-like [Malaya genurostris]XP_058467041.1 neural-cadherin-like [Malaya genurostris]